MIVNAYWGMTGGLYAEYLDEAGAAARIIEGLRV